jgi:hypothetical protein
MELVQQIAINTGNFNQITDIKTIIKRMWPNDVLFKCDNCEVSCAKCLSS